MDQRFERLGATQVSCTIEQAASSLSACIGTLELTERLEVAMPAMEGETHWMTITTSEKHTTSSIRPPVLRCHPCFVLLPPHAYSTLHYSKPTVDHSAVHKGGWPHEFSYFTRKATLPTCMISVPKGKMFPSFPC